MSFSSCNANNLINVETINGIPFVPSASPPQYNYVSLDCLMFGSSSDSTCAMCNTTSDQPFFLGPCTTAPWPCPTGSNVNFLITPPVIYGTLPFSVLPGTYALCYNFLTNPTTGIATFTINNLTTAGSPTVFTFDTYSSNESNISGGQATVFTVSGTAGQFQNCTLQMSCHGKNGSSVGYTLLPESNFDICPVYTA